MNKLKFIFIVTCLLSLFGCARGPQSVPTLSVNSREQIVDAMQNWQAIGKIGVRYEHNGHNVSFEWRQRKEKYYLYLYSPLASESARINGSPSGATLVTVDKQEYTSTSAERLIYEHLGWDLPVSKLVYWIRGIAAPNSSAKVANYDQYNQLLILRQDGWLIEYQAYHATCPVTLPEKMTVTNGKITVKFVIREWKK